MIYVLNGFLFILYWLADILPIITSLCFAAVLVFFVDNEVQNRANFRPNRESSYGDVVPVDSTRVYSQRPVDLRKPHTAQVLTLIVLGIWIVAQ